MNTILHYFEEHPDAKDDVMKAFYAYHAPHFRLHPKAHNFPSTLRSCQCAWCGRSRESVRHDDLPAHCTQRPTDADTPITDTLVAEEAKAHALFEKARDHVPRLVGKHGMDLALIHHTHGYDPETVAGIVEVPAAAMEEYHTRKETEQQRSRDAIVRGVIRCAD